MNEDYFDSNFIELTELSDDTWIISSKVKFKINQKIENVGTPLEEWDSIDFFRGVTTGLNKVFHISAETKAKLVSENETSIEIIEPLLRGRDIKRWWYDFADLYMIFTKQGIDINKYPAVKKYLDEFTVILFLKKTESKRMVENQVIITGMKFKTIQLIINHSTKKKLFGLKYQIKPTLLLMIKGIS